jgi:hypothetical protein
MYRAMIGWLCRQSPHVLVMASLLLNGCASLSTSLFHFQAGFPPQKVIESGDYRSFLVENQRHLSTCGGWIEGGWIECDVILFNLGFVYAYPQSPYRDLRKARLYLRELHNRFPQSPWASQGQVLLAFMNEQVGLEEAHRQLRTDLRTRDAAIRKLRGQLDRSREIDIEIEKRERELLR